MPGLRTTPVIINDPRYGNVFNTSQPSAPPQLTNPFYNTMYDLAAKSAPNYLSKFKTDYENMIDTLKSIAGANNIGNLGLGMFDIGNAGLGAYDIGNAGLGAYDIGNAGLGMYDIGKAGLGMYDVGDAGLGMFDVSQLGLDRLSSVLQGAGLGQYSSELLNEVANRALSNLRNPDASIAMGLAKDRISGANLAAEQSLMDELASRGGLRSGANIAQLNQLKNELAKQQSDAYRQIALDVERKAIEDALSTEQLRGGFFENAKSRELENAKNQMALNEYIGNTALSAFEGAKGRELENTRLGSSNYSDAMARALENAKLGSSNYSDAMARALENAKLGSSNYSDAMARALENAKLGSSNYSDAMARALENAKLGSSNFSDAMARALENAKLASTNYSDAMARALESGKAQYANQNALMQSLASLFPSLQDYYKYQSQLEQGNKESQWDKYQYLNDLQNNTKMQNWQNLEDFKNRYREYYDRYKYYLNPFMPNANKNLYYNPPSFKGGGGGYKASWNY